MRDGLPDGDGPPGANGAATSARPPDSTTVHALSALPVEESDAAVSDVIAAPVEETAPHDGRQESVNLVVLTLYSVSLRVAWIFKTESVVVPAFFDELAAAAGGGGAVLRSALPILNRVGQSVPQVFLSDSMRVAPSKGWFLLRSTLSMTASFGVLTLVAALLATGESSPARLPGWVAGALPWIGLVCYTAFFASNGTNQLAFGVAQGKLLRPNRRGRLLSWSTTLGSVAACGAAWWLLPPLLAEGRSGFVGIFAITAGGFGLSALILLGLRERPDLGRTRRPARYALAQTWRAVRRDPRLRAVGLVAALVILAQNIFPHYQALGRARGLAGPTDMMLWVVVQNVGTGVFGVIVGWVADRHGNALALRLSTPLLAVTPLLGLALAERSVLGGAGYHAVFFLLGLMPIVFRTLVNYTLELAPPSRHPRYVATLQVMQAAPLLFSVPFGLVAEAFGFAPIFLLTSAFVACGAVGAYLLPEPRTAPTGRR